MDRAVAQAARVVRPGNDYTGRIIGASGGGAILGWIVDRFAHSAPWGVVLGLFVGIAVGVYEVVKLYSAAMDAEQRKRGTGRPA